MISLYSGKQQIELKTFNFPSGEPHIEIPDGLVLMSDESDLTVTWRFNGKIDGLFRIAMLKNILDNECSSDRVINLELPFFPCARQDRHTLQGQPFSVEVVASIINSMNWSKVTVFDPHSDVLVDELNNCHVVTQLECLKTTTAVDMNLYSAIVAPDKGSIKKASSIANEYDLPLIVCNKVRNPSTGKLTSFEVIDKPDIELSKVLVVDDICDGGGTFIGVACAIEDALQVSKIDLYVTHGLFTKGFDSLLEHYNAIHCCFNYQLLD